MTTVAADAFTRTVANAWGTADTGGAWSLGGTTTDFSVNGTQGVIGGPAASAIRVVSLNSVSVQDSEQTADVVLNENPLTGYEVGFQARKQAGSGGDYYQCHLRLRDPASGQHRAGIVKHSGGTDVTLLANFNVTGIDYSTPGTVVHLKMQCYGTTTVTIQMKWWKDSDPEPSTWGCTITDSSSPIGAGGLGVFTQRYSGVTSTLVSRWDNYLGVDTIVSSNSVSVDVPNAAAVAAAPSTAVAGTEYVQDLFQRTSGVGGEPATTFGTAAPTGGPYTSYQSTTRMTVDGEYGKFALAGGATCEAVLLGVSVQDAEIVGHWKLDAAPTGTNGTRLGLVARAIGGSNQYYLGRVTIWPGTFLLQGYALNVNMGGTVTVNRDVTTPGTIVHLKMIVRGTNPTVIKTKVWFDDDPEPDWMYFASNSTGSLQVAGGIGVQAFQSSDAGTLNAFIDSLDAYAPELVPPPPTYNATPAVPTVVASGGGAPAKPVILHDIAQINYVRDQVQLGLSIPGGNIWSQEWVYQQTSSGTKSAQAVGNKVGFTSAQRLFYSNSYVFTPTANVDSDDEYQNWSDDATAAYVLALKGVIESDPAATAAAIAGIKAWISGPSKATRFGCFVNSTLTNFRGRLWIHWGGSRFLAAWSLLMQDPSMLDADVVAMQQWLRDVPCKGSLDPHTFIPSSNTNPPYTQATATATIMHHANNANWQAGIAAMQLYIGLLSQSTAGDNLIAYSQRFFRHVVEAYVFDPANHHQSLTAVPMQKDPNWSPVNEDSVSHVTVADTIAAQIGFPSYAAYLSGAFRGQMGEWLGSDFAHAAMTSSGFFNYISTYLLNGLGDPLAGSTISLATFAEGIETWAQVQMEIVDAAWALHGGDFLALEADSVAGTWHVTGTYTGWDWNARFGTARPWHTGDSGKGGGTENQFFMWDYLLRQKLGFDMPVCQALCVRLRGTSRSSSSAAGISVLTHAYSSSLTPLVFTTDQTFNEIQDGDATAGAPGLTAVATPPFAGAGSDVTLPVTDTTTAGRPATAATPSLSVTSGPPPNPSSFVDYRVGVTMSTRAQILYPSDEPIEIDLDNEPGWEGPIDAAWIVTTESDGRDDDRPEPHPDW